MDRLESLGNAISQITLYDIKSVYTQAKNVVMNVSEMEAKVREATNDEPWGASSTLMQEIASGTFNFQNFNEIMPCIYSRFMEKEAKQWREIYKALQLLEYLIKHGSERVIDDARSHISTIKMLRNFHYIDDKGKDEGMNVRNRAKELAELLSDVEKIRGERRKAKLNKHKYIGTGNDGMSFGGGGGRYGGFGSESGGYGGGSGGGYEQDYSSSYSGGGYSGGGGSSSDFRDSDRRGFEEYNAGDDEDVTAHRRSSSSQAHRSTNSIGLNSKSNTAPPRAVKTSSTAPPPKAKEPEVDLLGGLGDDDPFGSLPAAPSTKALPSLDGDDDFADFQAAPSTPSGQATAPPAINNNVKPNLMEMLKQSSPPLVAAPAAPPANFTSLTSPMLPVTNFAVHRGGSGMSMGTGGSMGVGMGGMSAVTSGMSAGIGMGANHTQHSQKQAVFGGGGLDAMKPQSQTQSQQQQAKKPASAAFDDLWSMSLGAPAKPGAGAGGARTGKSIKDLEKEKAQAGLWGSGGMDGKPGAMSNLGAFGNFGGSSGGDVGATGGGGDDLLL